MIGGIFVVTMIHKVLAFSNRSESSLVGHGLLHLRLGISLHRLRKKSFHRTRSTPLCPSRTDHHSKIMLANNFDHLQDYLCYR